jgi:uncharacterized radical SAM superfamily Fe-S cluster-containing enzyme
MTTNPIKETLGVCPLCLTKVPARVVERDGRIVLRKNCPVHGEEEVLLEKDARHYRPQPSGAAPCGSSGCAPGLGHSCTLIFEITDRCNLTCPTCFTASSPQQTWSMTLEDFERKLDALLAAGRDDADMVQLSGGEPTLHPDLPRMIEACFARGVRRVYVNTNGVRLARDQAFADCLARCNADGDRLQLYLQLDGFHERTGNLVRGKRGLPAIKRQAVENALARGLYVLPVMTVTPGVNLGEIGDVVRFALEHHPRINTVMLQPAFYAGRYDNERVWDRVTTGEVIAEVVRQTGGLFAADDFGPLPCSHPNCFALAVALVRSGTAQPISRYFPRFETWQEPALAARIVRFADRMPQNLLDLLAEDAIVDDLLDLLASGDDSIDWRDYRSFFLVAIKPFMDAHTYDQDRVDRCCVHVVDRSGAPVSLCEYNAIRRPRGLA